MTGTGSSGNFAYRSRHRWSRLRPKTLVVACSDGRLQENLDDFLQGFLGITQYDRLYMPGGPGALASSGIEFQRSDSFRRECIFLVSAHDVEEVILILHGPAEDGPPEAICADYRRVFPNHSPAQIRAEQDRDVESIVGAGFGWQRHVRVRVFRCEIAAGDKVQFVELNPSRQ